MGSNVWVLETDQEEAYSYILSERIYAAMGSHDPNERKSIRLLWGNEKWKSIIKKFQTEGSVWYVWWMDGVRAFIKQNNRKQK
jgi:hypothetical protein